MCTLQERNDIVFQELIKYAVQTFISFSDAALKYHVLESDLNPMILNDHFLSSDTASSRITLDSNT